MLVKERYNDTAKQMDVLKSKADAVCYAERSHTIETKLMQARMQENQELTGRTQKVIVSSSPMARSSPLRSSKSQSRIGNHPSNASQNGT
jgi:hypothetical protein